VNYRFEFDTDIEKLSKTQDFNQTLTVHPINDMETMLKLQKYRKIFYSFQLFLNMLHVN
jgi:CRISPR/Cas system-associated protein Cas10 (large subunit of type III CRISPR-Cas system)